MIDDYDLTLKTRGERFIHNTWRVWRGWTL